LSMRGVEPMPSGASRTALPTLSPRPVLAFRQFGRRTPLAVQPALSLASWAAAPGGRITAAEPAVGCPVALHAGGQRLDQGGPVAEGLADCGHGAGDAARSAAVCSAVAV
jgi:hypothetical protein